MASPIPVTNQYGQPIAYGYNPTELPQYLQPRHLPPNFQMHANFLLIQGDVPDNVDSLHCQTCGCPTHTNTVRLAGGTTYLWCCCLCCWTCIFCWIPFCFDSCLDAYMFCRQCNQLKGIALAKCCCMK